MELKIIMTIVTVVVVVVVVVSVFFSAFSLKNSNSQMAVILAMIHLRIFSECPKTSDHNSNAIPFKELQCFDALS